MANQVPPTNPREATNFCLPSIADSPRPCQRRSGTQPSDDTVVYSKQPCCHYRFPPGVSSNLDTSFLSYCNVVRGWGGRMTEISTQAHRPKSSQVPRERRGIIKRSIGSPELRIRRMPDVSGIIEPLSTGMCRTQVIITYFPTSLV